MKKELKPNLDHVIADIQVETIVFTKLVVSIIEFVAVAIESFQPVQFEIEPVQIEYP